jgi:hypothetical protein
VRTHCNACTVNTVAKGTIANKGATPAPTVMVAPTRFLHVEECHTLIVQAPWAFTQLSRRGKKPHRGSLHVFDFERSWHSAECTPRVEHP